VLGANGERIQQFGVDNLHQFEQAGIKV